MPRDVSLEQCRQLLSNSLHKTGDILALQARRAGKGDAFEPERGNSSSTFWTPARGTVLKTIRRNAAIGSTIRHAPGFETPFTTASSKPWPPARPPLAGEATALAPKPNAGLPHLLGRFPYWPIPPWQGQFRGLRTPEAAYAVNSASLPGSREFDTPVGLFSNVSSRTPEASGTRPRARFRQYRSMLTYFTWPGSSWPVTVCS